MATATRRTARTEDGEGTAVIATAPRAPDASGGAAIDPRASDPPDGIPRKRRVRPAWVAGGAIALTAGIMVAGALGPWPRPQAAVQAVGVGGASDVFTPPALTVTAGDSVTWTWQGGKHSVTSTGSEPFDSGSLSTGSFSHTFATAGTFSYICIWHSGMAGSITVVATPAPVAGTTPARPAPAAGATAQPASSAVAVARPGRPRLTGVRIADRRLRFRLSESATVAAVAFRGRSTHGTPIGSTLTSGPGTIALRLDRLQPARYRIVLRATDTGGQRSKATRVRYLLTRRVWQRATNAQRAVAKIPPAVAVPPAASAIAPPAVAPPATGPVPVPAPTSGDHGGDDGDHDGTSGSSDGGGSRGH